jgi:quercetin dioxygenase-like cupin family protein
MKARCVKLPGPHATIYFSDATGDQVLEHTHEYPHSCTVIFGSARTVCDGEETVLAAGQSVIFPAGLPHSIHPLEIGTIFVNASAVILPSEEVMFLNVENEAAQRRASLPYPEETQA